MFHTWHDLPVGHEEAALAQRWQLVREVKARASKVLEDVRTEGRIGSSLQAEVELRISGAAYDALAALGDDLRFVLITSKASLVKAADTGAETIVVTPSAHAKCGRCWHWREDVGHDTAHPELCGRCTVNLYGGGEARGYA
jgi:isoleucyl-tRNA synthetase